MRKRSYSKSFAARTSFKRYVRHNLGLKAPRGYGWITNPKKAAYNRVYYRQRKMEAALSGLFILVSIYIAVAIVKLAWLLLKMVFKTLSKLLLPNKNVFSHHNRVKIKYRDAFDSVTERNIEFIAIERSGIITAFCELRRENRSFRIDRIEECVDLNTGEVIENLHEYFEKTELSKKIG